jgi:carbonic anhydrase
MPEYEFVKTERAYRAASELFREYSEWLGIDLSFQHFEDELKDLKTMYAAPLGAIILCSERGQYIGCVAIRPQEKDIAELKRMYVKPAHRGSGIGRELLQRSLLFAREAGYKKARLDTLNTMQPAMNLYENNGFYRIPAYYFNPENTAVYFEKVL